VALETRVAVLLEAKVGFSALCKCNELRRVHLLGTDHSLPILDPIVHRFAFHRDPLAQSFFEAVSYSEPIAITKFLNFHRASWLPKMVEWGCTSHPGAMIQAPKDPFVDTAPIRAWTPVTDEVIAEVEDSMDSIRALYSSSWLESMSTPRNVSYISQYRSLANKLYRKL
jgi:hypothetical protein